MKDLVEYIAKSIVNAPDDVEVTEETDERGLVLKLTVADDDTPESPSVRSMVTSWT